MKNPSLYRILDANLNRFREALRVIEDYCRFHHNHASWSSQFKSIRHSLVEFEEKVQIKQLLLSRQVEEDVGTEIKGSQEFTRNSLFDVLRANFNRLKEALRTLEEYSKLLAPEMAPLLEQKRYLLYKLEQEILIPKSLANKKLYCLLTPSLCKEPYLDVTKKLIDGGIDLIQLREKNIEDRKLLELAESLENVLHQNSILFFINDRPDIATLVGADGVHLGQEDLPLKEVRKNFPALLIGVSTHQPAEASIAAAEKADYIGAGPTFPSKTKQFDSFSGLEYLSKASQVFLGPLFAIGGIDEDNLQEVLATGVTRIALSSALIQTDNIVEKTSRIRKQLDSAS